MPTTPIVRKYNLETQLDGLTDKEQMFVAEYLVDGNATRAATAAGYKSAGTIGQRMLKKDKIAKAIGALKFEYLKEQGLKQEEVLERLKHVILRDVADMVDPETGTVYDNLRKMPKHARAAIDGFEQEVKETIDRDTGEITRTIKTKIKLVPLNPAVELGMKHFGMLAPEQREVKVTFDLADLYGRPDVAENVIDLDAIDVTEKLPYTPTSPQEHD